MGELGKEGVALFLADAGFAAAVDARRAAADGKNVGNDRGKGFVAGAGRRDEAVAIEACGSKDAHAVGRVLGADRFACLAEILEDLARRGEHGTSVVTAIVYGRKRQRVGTGRQQLAVAQQIACPLAGGDEITGADVAVAVGIEQRQRAGIEGQSLHRTGERNP